MAGETAGVETQVTQQIDPITDQGYLVYNLDDQDVKNLLEMSDKERAQYIEDATCVKLYNSIAAYLEQAGQSTIAELDPAKLLNEDVVLAEVLPALTKHGFSYREESTYLRDRNDKVFATEVAFPNSLANVKVSVTSKDPRVFVLSVLWVQLLGRLPSVQGYQGYFSRQIATVVQLGSVEEVSRVRAEYTRRLEQAVAENNTETSEEVNTQSASSNDEVAKNEE